MIHKIVVALVAAAAWRLRGRVAALEELIDVLQAEIGRLDDELDMRTPVA